MNGTLVQVIDNSDGLNVGLYLLPENVTVDEFETAIKTYDDQDDFDETNFLGVKRIFVEESILDLNF